MHIHRPPLTKHRLQRFILWTLAMLHWVGAVLRSESEIGPRHLRQRGDISLGGLTRLVTALLIFRALHLLGRVDGNACRWRRGRDLHRAHFRRSLLGADLRRALTAEDGASHVAKLIAVLRDLDAYAARLMRRFRRLRRYFLRTTPPIARCPQGHTSAEPAPVLCDSS